MGELSAVALGNQVMVSYDLPFRSSIPDKFSFTYFFDIDEYKNKLENIKRKESAVIDGEYGKIEVSKNGYLYDILLFADLTPVIIKSGNPFKDLKI